MQVSHDHWNVSLAMWFSSPPSPGSSVTMEDTCPRWWKKKKEPEFWSLSCNPAAQIPTPPQDLWWEQEINLHCVREWDLKIVTVLFTLTNTPSLGKRSPISALSGVTPPSFYDLGEKSPWWFFPTQPDFIQVGVNITPSLRFYAISELQEESGD